MDSNGVGKSTRFLKQLETGWDLEAPLKVQVRTLRLELGFLAAFLCFQGKRRINVSNSRVPLDRVRAVVQNANTKLQSARSDLANVSSNENRRLPANLDRLVTRVLESIVLVKPDLQQIYSTISKSSGSTTVLATDNDVLNLIYFLLESMGDLLRFEVDTIAPVRKEVEAVEVSLRFLRYFFGFIARRCGKDQNIKDLRTHVTVLAHNMACLLCLSLASSKMDDLAVRKTKLALFSQLQNVKPIQAKVRKIYIEALNNSKSPDKQNIPEMDEFVMGFLDSLLLSMKELSETKVISSMISIKVRILALEEEMRFFTHFMIDMSPKGNSNIDLKINGFVKCIIPLICEAGRVIYSFYSDQINESMSMKLSSAISDLLEKLKVARVYTTEIYLPMSLRSNFPRTNEMGFISSLLQNLKEILKFKADSVAPMKHQFEEVQKGLLSLQEHFSTTANHPSKHGELKDQLAHFMDIAYLSEYVIDSFFIGDYPLWCYELGLSYVTKEFKCIQMKLTIDPVVPEISSLPSRVPPIQADPTKIDVVVSCKDVDADEKKHHTTEMVVFEDEEKRIMEQLTGGLPKLHILSIVGMPGVGKTTLANSIFENPSVACDFHVRARCCVSQAYQKRRLLLEILQQVTAQTEDYKKMCNEDLEQKACQSLKGRRYLILLDDIWDIRPWEDMRSSFPNENKQSRIIFTSRLQSIASQVECSCFTYSLYPLSDEKAWEMLQIKLFQKQSCPEELAQIGQQIAKICKGLPLAIGLVAGVLRVREPKETCWRQVAECLTTELLDNHDGQFKSILELSYNHLPDHLKPCFLYFGAFPEDSEIPTRKLIPMWIAEGFVQLQNPRQRSFEYVAETYLNELISRSLITISKRRSLGGVKASRVHDLLGEFARAKAKEDGFFLLVDRSTINCHALYGAYRLSIHGCPDFWQVSPPGLRIRSLLFHQNLVDFFYFEDFLKKLRLLRVLDLLTILCILPDELPLVHLRFLALYCADNGSIIPTIACLQNLETFQLNTRKSKGFDAKELFHMKRLRHCHSNTPLILESLGQEEMERLDNLQTLATLRVEYNGKTEEILRQFPKLEGLKCEFSNPQLSTEESVYFPKLGFHRHLKSLNMSNNCAFEVPHPCELSFPAYLKKLTLSKFYWPWSEISIIGKLEHLEVLKLRYSAFRGEFWSMRDGEFRKLKFLSLCELDIEEWNASEDHLPCLERLKVHHCSKLEELPTCLANIATLKSIEMKGCNPSTEMSAKSIEEEQKDLGNDEFVATIYS